MNTLPQVHAVVLPQESDDRPQSRLELIWGDEVMDAGFTTVPNLLVWHGLEVGLSMADIAIIVALMTFKHGAKDVFVSKALVAGLLGISRQTVVNHLSRLRNMTPPLIEVTYRQRHNGSETTSIVSLKPLISRLVEVAKARSTFAAEGQKAHFDSVKANMNCRKTNPLTPATLEVIAGSSSAPPALGNEVSPGPVPAGP